MAPLLQEILSLQLKKENVVERFWTTKYLTLTV